MAANKDLIIKDQPYKKLEVDWYITVLPDLKDQSNKNPLRDYADDLQSDDIPVQSGKLNKVKVGDWEYSE